MAKRKESNKLSENFTNIFIEKLKEEENCLYSSDTQIKEITSEDIAEFQEVSGNIACQIFSFSHLRINPLMTLSRKIIKRML